MAGSIVETFTEIQKGKTDNRQYRGLVLKNKLKVMLISDSDLNISAASLNLNIGSSSDPDTLPGLAHFCEHMLFLGSEKHPSPEEFASFISKHNGQRFGSTFLDNTNCEFEIDSQFFEEALERFAQIFIAPLFDENYMKKELDTIQSEFESIFNFLDSKRKSYMCYFVDKETCDQTHDYHKFECGNKETLKDENLRERLVEFHSKFYSSNLMTLCLMDRSSLDDMQRMICGKLPFVQLKNTEIKAKQTSRHEAFKKEHLKKLITIYTEASELILDFIVSDTKLLKYMSFLKFLLFKDNIICSNSDNLDSLGVPIFVFDIGQLDFNQDMCFYESELLCDNPENAKYQVEAILEFLERLKRSSDKWKSFFDVFKRIEQTKWNYQDKMDYSQLPSNYCRTIAFQMHSHPFKEVLAANLPSEFEPEVFEQLLDHLKVENLRVTILCEKFKGKTKRKEKYFSIQYNVEPLPRQWLEAWSDLDPAKTEPKESSFLDHIEFIPNNLELVKREEKINFIPVLLKQNELLNLWYFQDLESNLPKSSIVVHIKNPIIYRQSISYACMGLFNYMMHNALLDLLKFIYVAGYTCTFSTNSSGGILIKLHGWSFHLPLILKQIVENLSNFDFEQFESSFELHKQAYLIELRLYQTSIYAMIDYYFEQILREDQFSAEELLRNLSRIKITTVKNTVDEFLKNIFLEIYAEGNVTKTDTFEIEEIIRKALIDVKKSHPIAKKHLKTKGILQLRKGSHYILDRKIDKFETNGLSCYYQYKSIQSPEESVKITLVGNILSDKFYHIIRTEEQLSYELTMEVRNDHGVKGIHFFIISTKDPTYLDSRIENFIEWSRDFLKNLSPQEFETHVESTKKCKISRRSRSHFSFEILEQTLNFLKNIDEYQALAKISKEDVLDTFEEIFGKNRSKLSIRITGKKKDIDKTELKDESKAETKTNSENEPKNDTKIESNSDRKTDSKITVKVVPNDQSCIIIDDIRKIQRTLDTFPIFKLSYEKVKKKFSINELDY